MVILFSEMLSAAFDYNEAPYFQASWKFKVERSGTDSAHPLRRPGQLRWRDFDYGGTGKPASARIDDPAEWVLPMSI